MSGEIPSALDGDWLAIAAHAAHHDIANAAEALASWRALSEERRIAWRASADAVRMLLDTKVNFTPVGYQGPAQHTYTAACDGFHEPGQCPRRDAIHE